MHWIKKKSFLVRMMSTISWEFTRRIVYFCPLFSLNYLWDHRKLFDHLFLVVLLFFHSVALNFITVYYFLNFLLVFFIVKLHFTHQKSSDMNEWNGNPKSKRKYKHKWHYFMWVVGKVYFLWLLSLTANMCAFTLFCRVYRVTESTNRTGTQKRRRENLLNLHNLSSLENKNFCVCFSLFVLRFLLFFLISMIFFSVFVFTRFSRFDFVSCFSFSLLLAIEILGFKCRLCTYVYTIDTTVHKC